MEIEGEEEAEKLQAIMNAKGPSVASSGTAAAAAAAAAAATGSDGDGDGGGVGGGGGGSAPLVPETVYTRASSALVRAREELCGSTFKKARARLIARHAVVEALDAPGGDTADRQMLGALYGGIKDMTLNCSEIAGRRPVMGVRYAPTGALLASYSLAEDVRLWDTHSLESRGLLQGHTERVTGIAWAPASADAGAGSTCTGLLATSSADATCMLWSTATAGTEAGNNIMPLRTLQGHRGVVAAAAWHPDGKLVGTAGHDRTWRLWDVETGETLLGQDGLSQHCSALDFHPDGSLAATGDWAGVCALWDLRSGKRVHGFQGHGKKVVKCTFAPDGRRMASCGPDNTVRVWDLRNKNCEYSVPAHASPVTDVRFSTNGEAMVTSSFDGSLRVWGTRDYRLLSTLKGHSDKVMGCDVDPDSGGLRIASAGFDKNVKVWTQDEY